MSNTKGEITLGQFRFYLSNVMFKGKNDIFFKEGGMGANKGARIATFNSEQLLVRNELAHSGVGSCLFGDVLLSIEGVERNFDNGPSKSVTIQAIVQRKDAQEPCPSMVIALWVPHFSQSPLIGWSVIPD